MQPRQFAFEGIHVIVGEDFIFQSGRRKSEIGNCLALAPRLSTLDNPAYHAEHIQRPPAQAHGQVRQGPDAFESGADFGGRRRAPGLDDQDAGFDGDAAQGNVATDPTGASGGGGKGRTFDDGRRRKGEVRDETCYSETAKTPILSKRQRSTISFDSSRQSL